MNNINNLSQATPDAQRKFITGVYFKMCLALAVTAAVAYFTPFVYQDLISQGIINTQNVNFFVWTPMVLEIVLVLAISFAINKISPAVAYLLFVLYSIMTGISISSIFFWYSIDSIFRVFAITSLMFLGMTLYGIFTKSDLTSAGRYLMMGLIGIIIASVLNIFLKSSGLDWAISIIGVGIFVGLTAYDTQKIMNISVYSDGSANFKKYEILGALELYLDFINMFLRLLSLLGKRK